MVVLLLSSLVVLACGCSLREKSPSTWHGRFMCMPRQWLWWRCLLGTTTVLVNVVVVVVVDVVHLVDVVVVVVVSCCMVIVIIVVVVVNIERDV